MSAAPPNPPPIEPVAKISAEALALRSRPRPIVRFRRGLLIGVVAVGAIGLSGLAWFALSPPTRRDAKAEPPPAAQDNQKPDDAVAGLPSDYAAAGPPKLGPPLPGDLGRAIVDQQAHDAMVAGAAPSAGRGRSPAEQAAAAEVERRAADRRQAREAGVLVQVGGRTGSATPAGLDLAALAAMTPPAPAAQAGAAAGDRKSTFLETTQRGEVYNAHTLEIPRSPFQVMAGSVIAASLLTGLNSDLPGLVTAQVTENVYDTVTGQHLLIPQGSRLIGAYDSVVAFGQSRALLVWQRIILPDGASIQLDNLPGTDAAGYAGLEDKVDFHTWRLLQGVALSTLLGVSTELSLGDNESDLVRAIRQSTQQTAAQAGQQIISKQLDVQPTIRVRPGWPLRVVVHKDLVLRPWRQP